MCRVLAQNSCPPPGLSLQRPQPRPLHPHIAHKGLRGCKLARRSPVAAASSTTYLVNQWVTTTQEVASCSDDLGWRTDFDSHYVRGKVLGAGSFGSVFKAVELHTGQEVAVKIMPKTRGKLTKEKTLEKLSREVEILERLQGSHGVIGLEDCFEDASTVTIVTELCSGGDLQKLVDAKGPLSESSLALVAYEVLRIVQACHEMGILHGDVKPANFCLKSARRNPLANPHDSSLKFVPWLKAIDFGCSQPVSGARRLTKRTGTPVYMAPEIFARDYAHAADVWSTGVMLYQLFSKRFPFWQDSDSFKASKLEEVAEAVTTAPIKYDYGPWLKMSPEGHDFVQRCLARDQRTRLSVQEALQHPWILKHVFGDMPSSAPMGNNILPGCPVYRREGLAAAA